MKLLILIITGLLTVSPINANDSGENECIDQPDSDSTFDYSREGGLWYTLISGHVGHSFLGYNNFTVGVDLAMMHVPYGGMRYSWHTPGLEYQHHIIENGPQSIIRINYAYFRYVFYFGAGLGISGFYNITAQDIGIAPKIGGSLSLGIIMFNYYYRYNLVLNNVNASYHETVFSLSINVPIN